MFSVNVLLYGDYPSLARRCLQSLVDHIDKKYVAEVRIGLNAVSPATLTVLRDLVVKLPVPYHLYHETHMRNVGKYPLMRQMFYDSLLPLRDNVMWFDDDSYLCCGPRWWETVSSWLDMFEVVGSIYRMPLLGDQAKAIAAQKWFGGRPVKKGQLLQFVTGGWWAARRWVLQQWDYPFPALHHNGGDQLFGALCYQQNFRLKHFSAGVSINANEEGKESKAERRGISTVPLWSTWQPDHPDDLSHQQFDTISTSSSDN
jgi:hypothetical protein